MTIALLATGNEIIDGDVLNTNGREMAAVIAAERLRPGMHLVVGDQENDIYQGLEFLVKQHDVVIITGGLGPTSDDKTRFAVSRFLDLPLIEFQQASAHLQNILRQLELAQSTSNKQQTLFPENAILLPNPFGTAMGCYCAVGQKLFFLLPGPPKECLPMFHHYVLPKLQTLYPLLHDTKLLKWRLFGVAESEIGQRLDDALKHLACTTGYRLEMPYVEFKVWCTPQLQQAVKNIVEPIIRPHLIASTAQKASEHLMENIVQGQKRICILDEATGGVLQSLILTPQTWPWLSFHNTANCAYTFHLQGLQEYWQQQAGSSTTLTIHYQANLCQNDQTPSDHIQTGSEEQILPFRSSTTNIVHFAAEWLSFRITELIQQLHQGSA